MVDDRVLKLADCIFPGDVRLDLEAADTQSLFSLVGRQMEENHGVEAGLVERSLLRREQVGSTGLGRGFAIPHARIAALDRTYAFYARLARPIGFKAPDGKPVDGFLVLLVPTPATDAHLLLLAEASQVFATRNARERLQAARTPEEVIRVFRLPDGG